MGYHQLLSFYEVAADILVASASYLHAFCVSWDILFYLHAEWVDGLSENEQVCSSVPENFEPSLLTLVQRDKYWMLWVCLRFPVEI